MIDLDAYCVRCDSSEHTQARGPGHHRWCWTCNDWQQEIPRTLRALLDGAGKGERTACLDLHLRVTASKLRQHLGWWLQGTPGEGNKIPLRYWVGAGLMDSWAEGAERLLRGVPK